jgi:hypothetical protein
MYLVCATSSLIFFIDHRFIFLVDSFVIQGIIREYWKKVFPDQNFVIDIDLSREQKIEMFIELPLLTSEKQQKILEKAEGELTQILQKHLGYRREFLISILLKN